MAEAKPKRKSASKQDSKPASRANPKTKAKPKRPATGRKRSDLVPLPSLKEALEWRGMRIDDSSGRSLGKVTGIHADPQTEEAKWVIAKIGMFTGEAAIPFEHVAEAGGRIWAAYDRDAIRNSPKLRSRQTLNARQELQLCEHYGVREGVGRAAEIADRDGDEVSAVPVAEA